ncbi:MAG: 16S rRNA (uracil(1498)-N(3))-methyltransferase [Buchnera aphidicola (Periphyllus acericola)]|uniref:16S rRNA (uracil(1498)-N(3))-methyltransferase n=1 Tax=Buchnera aphidicola TaxID=9 RepID=UPI0030D24F59|nr:16S rRNA (uracil(1498)-N(3))-methyltransferase [Buchnera aphidicola (Periphyllus acericola)]
MIKQTIKKLPRIYLNQKLKTNQEISISNKKNHYIISVIRMKCKEFINIFNNTNYLFKSKIIKLSKKKIVLKIIKKKLVNNESFLKINLGQSISRNEKMSWIIQKASELGVYSITPLICKNSFLFNKNYNFLKKINRWKKISISASEQCQRNSITKIFNPTNLKDWVNSCNNEKNIIFTPNINMKNKKNFKKKFKKINILIGSEIGFSLKEIKFCIKNNFSHMNLGNRILRTETACITAISIIQYKYGDLNILNK